MSKFEGYRLNLLVGRSNGGSPGLRPDSPASAMPQVRKTTPKALIFMDPPFSWTNSEAYLLLQINCHPIDRAILNAQKSVGICAFKPSNIEVRFEKLLIPRPGLAVGEE